MLDLSPAIPGLRRSLIPAALVALLIGATDAQARRTRPRGPIFGGLQSATTCTSRPGETAPDEQLSLGMATREGPHVAFAQNHLRGLPRHSTGRGELLDAHVHHFCGSDFIRHPTVTDRRNVLLRGAARDRRGQEDSNTVEREGQNLCE